MREENRSPETPHARRRQEVAAILAAGVLRCRRMASKTASYAFTGSCGSHGKGGLVRPLVPAAMTPES